MHFILEVARKSPRYFGMEAWKFLVIINDELREKLEGLYFCEEVMNIDGPCGGYNLQWSFASGCLAGKMM